MAVTDPSPTDSSFIRSLGMVVVPGNHIVSIFVTDDKDSNV
jgi:hypothetical protein